MNKDEIESRFVALQSELKNLTQKLPMGTQNWDYQKAVHFKKVEKQSVKFLALKPSGAQNQLMKLENYIFELKRFY